MGLLDGILGQLGSPGAIDAIAEKVGIPPAMAEAAVAALGKAHPEPGDTIESAAQSTGLDAGTLGKVVEQMGGDGALGQLAGMLKDNPQVLSGVMDMLGGKGGSEGGALGGLAGIAGSLLGGKN